jgi:hypothetical protein
MWGSLKSLEKYLATVVPEDKARNIMSPLVGAYELRVGDAHLPSSDIEEAYRLARVDSTAPGLQQGFRILTSVVSTLMNINKSLSI